MFSTISQLSIRPFLFSDRKSAKKGIRNPLKLDLRHPTKSWISVFDSLGVRAPFIQSIQNGQVYIMGLSPGNYTINVNTPEGVFRMQISITH